jgi:haloacid dehalogenase superfamily, subfamily IA, variant 3 with third motif having DD or ED
MPVLRRARHPFGEKDLNVAAPEHSAIEGVVFDLGGVVIDWNPMHLYERIFDGDTLKARSFLDTVCTDAWNGRQDGGRDLMAATEEKVAEHPQWAREIRAYYGRWIEMIGGSIPGTFEVMLELKALGLKLFAASNWHCETFARIRNDYPALDLFDEIVLSGEHGVIKPDRRFFDIALKCYAMPVESLVFIDDRADNIEGAAAAGLSGIVFTGADDLRRALIARGVPLQA